MKRLLLLRHAKSSWDDPSLDDFSRPLAARGLRAAPRMGRHIASAWGAPDRVLCSPAERARQTWALVAETLGGEPDVTLERAIYMAAPSTLLRLAQTAPADTGSLMLVGHNPGMEELAARLARPEGTPGHRRLREKFPTAALAVLEFDCETWGELDWGEGSLVSFVRPKDLD